LYIVDNTLREEHVDSTSNEEEDIDIKWGKYYVAKEHINITTITPLYHESLVASVFEMNFRYYVDMPIKSTTINQGLR
jgi:hypothetical protein